MLSTVHQLLSAFTATCLLTVAGSAIAQEQPAEDNPDIPTYDIGDNFHQYPPDYREPDPEAPVRYGRTTSKTFPLQALEQTELAEAQVPGALQATAAGQALSDQEAEIVNSDGSVTIEELENTGTGFSLILPTATPATNNTSSISINNRSYSAGGTNNVNVQMDATVTTRN